jgi:signal transduction histidine kinase
MQRHFENLKQFLLSPRNYRIVITFGILFIVLLIETIEHHPFWRKTAGEVDFLREVTIFLLLIPASSFIIIRILDRFERERTTAAHHLDYYRVFSSRLAGAQTLDDLINTIVELPRPIFLNACCSLKIFDPILGVYKLFAQARWEPGKEIDHLPFTPSNVCSACKSGQPTILQALTPCYEQDDPQIPPGYKRFCLPLIIGTQSVGFLNIDIPEKTKMQPLQITILNTLAPEISLAIENLRLRSSIRNQVASNEAERKRIAQHLHDSLGQNISYLRLRLDHLTGENALSEITSLRLELERMRDIANDAYNQVRGTLDDLQPVPNDALDTAIIDRLKIVSARANINLVCNQTGSAQPIPAAVKRQALYILREAINNIEKHAQASTITLDLDWAENGVDITLRDDGKGFDRSKIDSKGHYGLVIMQERAQTINALLETISSTGAGTQTHLWVPLESVKELGIFTLPGFTNK